MKPVPPGTDVRRDWDWKALLVVPLSQICMDFGHVVRFDRMKKARIITIILNIIGTSELPAEQTDRDHTTNEMTMIVVSSCVSS